MVSPDGVVPSRMVGVSAFVNLPLHHKVQKFSSGTGSSGSSRKKGRKTVVVNGSLGVCVCVCSVHIAVSRLRSVQLHETGRRLPGTVLRPYTGTLSVDLPLCLRHALGSAQTTLLRLHVLPDITGRGSPRKDCVHVQISQQYLQTDSPERSPGVHLHSRTDRLRLNFSK